MRKIITIIFIFTLLDLNATTKTNTAIFIFKSEKNLPQKLLKVFSTVKIYINETLISRQDSAYKITSNSVGLDTIKISNESGEISEVLLAKIKPNQKYYVQPNINGSFNISPFNTNSGERSVRVIATNNNKQKLFFNGTYCFVDMGELQSKDTTSYYGYARTGEGPNPIMWAYICTKEEPADVKEYNDKNICNKVKIVFLFNEKYTIYYDFKTREMKVKFDGYSDGKEKIKY